MMFTGFLEILMGEWDKFPKNFELSFQFELVINLPINK